jgi:hypothetical protein
VWININISGYCKTRLLENYTLLYLAKKYLFAERYILNCLCIYSAKKDILIHSWDVTNDITNIN